MTPGTGSEAYASVHDFAIQARNILPIEIWNYVAGGAGDELTILANTEAFRRVFILPRTLVDVSTRDLHTTILGRTVSGPLGIAPMSYHQLVHVDGERATVKAAGAHGLVMVLSVFSSISLEDVARVATGPVWFQTYCFRDRSITESLVHRAKAAGSSALVLTIDAPAMGYRDRDIRGSFRLPRHVVAANFRDDVRTATDLDRAGEIRAAGLSSAAVSSDDDSPGPILAEMNDGLVAPSATWRDVEWLRGLTDLPLVLKGIQRADDAAIAANIGVEGVVVSNHGGRQVDGARASLDALPEVVATIGDRCEVFVDGGIRRGSDILKALALGARAAFVGRPILWGLAVGGGAGVHEVIGQLLGELDVTMASCGCPAINDIGPELVARASGP